MEAHAKLRPVDCATDGVFICGLAHAPKPIDESVAQAAAAAATINAALCKGCGLCVASCRSGAIRLEGV